MIPLVGNAILWGVLGHPATIEGSFCSLKEESVFSFFFPFSEEAIDLKSLESSELTYQYCRVAGLRTLHLKVVGATRSS